MKSRVGPNTHGAATPPHDGAPTREEGERVAAWRRGEAQAHDVAGTPVASGAAATGPRAAAVDRAFAAFAENVRDYAIFLMDPTGTITFWGEGARRIKGWTKAEAEGAHLRLLYPPGGAEDGTAEAHLATAAAHGEYVGEGQRVRSDGASFWAHVAITALRDDAGELLGFAKLSRDLTARRAAEALRLATAETAEVARQAAEAASAAKNGFLATISHELRTPVNAILGYAELLAMELDGPLTAGQQRHLEAARASGRHLLALITQVLDFSHVDGPTRERAADPPSAVVVAPVIADALASVAPAAAERGLELVDAVRESPLALTGWGDGAGVRQILGNLLDNALKFNARRAGDARRITVRAGVATRGPLAAALPGAGPWVYVCVEDTGVGIAADQLEAMFEPFVQGDMRLTRTHGGLGLGLAIGRRLARRMGGDVTAQSELGVGSAFFLWLPAAPAGSLADPGTGGGETGPDDAASSAADRRDDAPTPADVVTTVGASLRAVSDAVLGELDRILHAYVARLRTDPGTPSAHAVDEAQIEDHVAAFLGNLAGTLPSLGDPAVGMSSDLGHGRATPTSVAEAQDGVVIQRVVAQRHGAQRARLGWTEAELRREYAILREELVAAVHRRAVRARPGLTADAARQEVAEALAVLTRFLGLAERLSLAEYHATRAAVHPAEEPGTGAGTSGGGTA